MTELKKIIKNRIIQNGPLSLSEYMTLSLYHNKFGYYKNKIPIGLTRDFITSPEVSQTFGELLGLWLVSIWEKVKVNNNTIIADLGPGLGTLMSDAMRAIRTTNKGLFNKIGKPY